MTRFVVAISIVVALASTMPARAAANLEIAPALGSKVGFVFPVVAAVKAQPITFLQVDGNAPHNMVSAVDDGEGGYKILYGPDGAPWCQGFAHGTCPLFRSGNALNGPQNQSVDLRNTVTGHTYWFFCEIHHDMRAQLEVVA